jgi:hypothetical protein
VSLINVNQRSDPSWAAVEATAIETICREFEGRVGPVVARILERMRSELPEFRDFEGSEVFAITERVSRASRQSQAAHLARGAEVPTKCPAPDIEAVIASVQSGISGESLLHGYRIAHAVSLEAWMDCVEEAPIEDDLRRRCMSTISRFVTAYDDHVMRLVGEEFAREQAARRGSIDRQRMTLVRELLDGSRDDLDGIEYDLSAEHLGVVAWGDAAEVTLRRLSVRVGRRLLSTRVEDGLLIAWLTGNEPFAEAQRRSMQQLDLPAPVACGKPLWGLAGFRLSHRQAGEAYVVAVRTGERVTFYDDVALEALALRDEGTAAEFSADELGALDADDARYQELRDTLGAYYAASHNKVAAAAALGVHERTVARRLREIEHLTGRQVDARRTELEVALRIRALTSRR